MIELQNEQPSEQEQPEGLLGSGGGLSLANVRVVFKQRQSHLKLVAPSEYIQTCWMDGLGCLRGEKVRGPISYFLAQTMHHIIIFFSLEVKLPRTTLNS